MKQRYLKFLRVVVSLLFLICTFVVFLDLLGKLSANIVDSILYFQFTPSLIAFIKSAGLASSGFLFVLLVTFLAGRVFCSFICPLGGMQDIFIFIHKQLKKHTRKYVFSFQRPFPILRYSIFIITVLSCTTGNLLLLSLLDPFSQFGRITSDVFRPLYAGLYNILSDTAQWCGIYLIYPLEYKAPPFGSLVLPFVILVLLISFTAKQGRLFCNTLCPVGTLLGILSVRSIFRIGIDRTKCTKCATCVMLCKTGCIDIKNQKIDLSRCVSCYNCIHSCPEDALRYYYPTKHRSASSPHRFERRAFIISLFSLAFYCPATRGATPPKPEAPQVRNKLPTTIINEKNFPVVPPGSKSIADFLSFCTACHLCISVCPTGVLQPSLGEYGINGFLKPRLDPLRGFCNFECTRCGEVCPTGAIQPLTVQKKKSTQMGKAQFIKKNCVVETDKKDCGACAEHCPTKAVRMVPFEGKLKIPELDNKYCIGCGACEHICPVRPHRAIFVDGLARQSLAEPPVSKPVSVPPMEDFPF